MKLISSLLGEMEFSEEEVVSFAEGIPGFEGEKRFLIIPLEASGPFYYLHSAENPDLCLVLAQPFVFFPDYEIEIPDDELKNLGLTGAKQELAVYVILTIPEDFRLTTANLLAPVLVNPETRQARQYVAINTRYTTRHPIFSTAETQAASAAGEGR